jgi:GMP synthase-like glutamine amidotransferase
MDKPNKVEPDLKFVEALRQLIKPGVMAAQQLEHSLLIDMPVVLQHCGPNSSPAKRAHTFIEVLRWVIRRRLEGKEAETANILFGFEEYAGVPAQDRFRQVAKLYNPYWTWENYRREPLTRHLFAVYLALKRESELATNLSFAKEHRTSISRHAPVLHNSSKVLIVQNITHEAPGLLERLLKEVAVDYEIADLHKGDPFPDPTGYAALVVLGGPDSANDKTSKMLTELERVQQALDAGVPYLGVCLGLQVAVKAMGGEVVKNHVKEIGLSTPDGEPYSVSLTNLALTALGKKDPLFLGLGNSFRVFQLHGETVELVNNMQLLAVGKDCRNQIVKLRRNAYGIQSHFELTREMLTEWLKIDPDLNPLNKAKVLAEFDAIQEVYTITGLSLLRNFLHIAGVIA